jgi:hypothetical protein
MQCKRFLFVVICVYLNTQAYGQTYKNEFGFKSDNDSYLAQGSDRYYTNGLFIHYRRAVDQSKLRSRREKKIYEITAGQRMYNPISGQSPDPSRHDRPFAGYLFAGAALTWYNAKEELLKAGLELGTTGPHSLAQDAQELLHKTIGFYQIAGWEYQIGNALHANASVQYTRLIGRSAGGSTDFSFDGYAQAGTIFNAAGAGILFRTGRINQLFNSATTNAVIANQSKTKALTEREFFFYAKPELNYIAYDATVEGSLFNDNSPVTYGVKPLLFRQLLGVNYSSRRFTFDFSIIVQSRALKSRAYAHQYGSVSMYYRFN